MDLGYSPKYPKERPSLMSDCLQDMAIFVLRSSIKKLNFCYSLIAVSFFGCWRQKAIPSRVSNWESSGRTSCWASNGSLEKVALVCPLMVWGLFLVQCYPCNSEPRPSGYVLQRHPGSWCYKGWVSPWLFCCKNLRCICSQNCILCLLLFLSSRSGRVFPGLTKCAKRRGFVTRSLLYAKTPLC